jgi:UDP-N-acetylglucosamine--N-acetylmuramyl-(pentapeptide) pyrophosphoryl-undecaprenol N-acetylglucosamine transferase
MKLFISAGGTGGHIFPGIAVGEACVAADRANEVVFIGTRYGLEGKIIPRYGFRLIFIESRQFLGKNALHKLATLAHLLLGICLAARLMRKEKPQAVLGMGGFTSVPMVLAAFLLGVPTFIHEQNVQPGLANRLLSRFVACTFISFDETRGHLKTRKVALTGNPTRRGLQRSEQRKPEGTFGIFIFGGSRGAHSINESVVTLLPYIEGYTHVVMYHQTGPEDYERVREAYEKTAVKHEVFPFTDEMAKYYGLSDVVISRAGASTIFELAYFRRAAILIPYPFSAGQHQWKNASSVEKLGGAYVVNNNEATGERLFEVLRHLMAEPHLLKEMGENIGKLYVTDAAERIVQAIGNEIRGK